MEAEDSTVSLLTSCHFGDTVNRRIAGKYRKVLAKSESHGRLKRNSTAEALGGRAEKKSSKDFKF
jgi:hypothetical protein